MWVVSSVVVVEDAIAIVLLAATVEVEVGLEVEARPAAGVVIEPEAEGVGL